MIPSQTSLLSDIQPLNNLLSSRQQQQLYREQQEQRQQQRRRYEDPEEHRYIGYLLRLYERDPERYQQHLDELEHQTYLQRRSPTFNEITDEIFQERQLEDYYIERRTSQERQEVWEQERLNEFEGSPAQQPYGLLLDNLHQYVNSQCYLNTPNLSLCPFVYFR